MSVDVRATGRIRDRSIPKQLFRTVAPFARRRSTSSPDGQRFLVELSTADGRSEPDVTLVLELDAALKKPMTLADRVLASAPTRSFRRLGAGGMGEVYRAATRGSTGPSRSRSCRAPLVEPRVRQRFEREAKTISQLKHPHICTLYDVGHDGGVDYLVMEFLEGETLADRLAQGALPPEQVCATESRSPTRSTGRTGRDRPSRSEARQRHADEVGREAPRLRPGEGGGRRRRSSPALTSLPTMRTRGR